MTPPEKSDSNHDAPASSAPATGYDKPESPTALAPATGSAHRDFLAFLLYASDSGRRGEIPCRWGTLRDDLKETWLNTADNRLVSWLADEEAAKQRREAHDPRAFFC